MIPVRRERKAWPLFLVVLGVIALTGWGARLPLAAATTERVVNDRHTGLAIEGVDPVSYFTNSKPLLGQPEIEYRHEGVVWRFRNEGNRAAFVQDPQVYMPRYGGYDPVAVTRGVAVAGNPLVWAISRDRLYLFYSGVARAQFIANTDNAVAAADARWPSLRGELGQY